MKKIKTLLPVLVVLIFFAESCTAQAKRIRISDFSKLVHVSDPEISPNGKSIVLVVARADMKRDQYSSKLVLIDIATRKKRTLTYEHKNVSSPRWSPSGDRLAFLAESSDNSSQQIFVLPMNGGEAKQITDAQQGVEQFAWRPDGKAFAYVTSDEPNDKAIKAHHDAFEVGDTDYLETSAALPSHVWLVSSDGGKITRLTSGTWSLPIAYPPSSPPSPLSWSPDGKNLLITKQETPEPGDGDMTTIQVLNVATKKMRKLTSHQKLEGYGVYSPDGSRIAYWYSRDGDLNSENEIYVTSTSGGDGTDLTRQLDRDMMRAIWMPDGKSLLVGADDGTTVSLWIFPLHGRARKINLGNIIPSWFFWVDVNVGPKGELAFTGGTLNHPDELYYMSSLNAKPIALTNYNAYFATLEHGNAQTIEWESKDGFHEDGALFYPPDFLKEKKYPLLLLIHGGPQASSITGFGFLSQLFAAKGYLVFEPNYRGSDNLGNAYQRAIYRDAGKGPGEDVMEGVVAVEKMGFVDTRRMAVSGGSYGGYMTSWLISHYNVWKAAVSAAAVNDLTVQAAASDNNRLNYYAMGGSPWVGENWKIYRDQSPITYASQIRTPTLIMSDTGDFRVPVVQSYEMFHALKDNGVKVKFIAFPVVGHSPGDPVRIQDILNLWVDWISRYLK